MQRTVLGLCVVAGLGVTGYLLAGDGGGDKKGCGASTVAAKESGGGCCGGGAAALAENANYKRANELLKSWQEAPVRLAAMSETEKTELEASFKKLHEAHPAVAAFEPTMAILHEGLVTLTQLDAAAKQLCAEAAAAGTPPTAGEGTVALAKAEGSTCPKTAAAMASAKSKMKQSVALTAKANELMLVAYQAACSGKGECTQSEGSVALASAEDKPAKSAGGCCGDKSEAKLASAEDKSAGDKAEGGCCASKGEAKLASAADKSADGKTEGGCCGEKSEARLASAADKPEGGCGGAKTTAALASGEGKPCVKALVKKSQGIVTQSGQVLAQWQGAGIRLASMDGTERESLEKLSATVMASCPIGSRMPETLETVAGLLRDAAALNAQAMAECCRNPGVAKNIPAASKELAEARFQVISALINVLEKGNSTMKPARQVASAQ